MAEHESGEDAVGNGDRDDEGDAMIVEGGDGWMDGWMDEGCSWMAVVRDYERDGRAGR